MKFTHLADTVQKRRQMIRDEINFYKAKLKSNRVDLNQGIPPSIPKRIALLYQTRINLEKEKNRENMTVFFLNKHLNNKKLSSHLWFFEGVCRNFHPKYTAFIDVGTTPD